MVMWGGLATAHTNRAVGNFLPISNALRAFEASVGGCPTEEEGLKALVEKPANWSEELNWKQVMLKVPSDPWGIRARRAKMVVAKE